MPTVTANTEPALHCDASTTAEGHDWLLDAGCADPVIDLLREHGWSVVCDDLANVHCCSPDGDAYRMYVGFLPETPQNYEKGEVWRVSLNRADGALGWSQTFGSGTPSEAIAGFLQALFTSRSEA